jgi:TetR/AcrR family transcriptional regulator
MSSVTIPRVDPVPRMRSEDRRLLVLEAATAVFGERGYFGATTDGIAKAAGVSQPYVVRMFGTKEALFLAVLERALGRLMTTFRGVLAENPDAEPEQLPSLIGNAYGELLADRGLLLSLMHAFVLGSDPVVGPAARAGFRDVYDFLRTEAGFSTDEADDFLAHGMLLNTLIGLRMADEIDDPRVRDLILCAAPTKSDVLVDLAREQLA